MSVSLDRTGLLFKEETVKPTTQHGRTHIGTSGYSFTDWRGTFYPNRLKREQWLAFYARHFTAVEINATYYRTPPPASFRAMAERTPDNFEFWVKVPGQATHTDEDFSQDVKQLLEAVRPLAEAGKLKGYLAQFPYSFRRSSEAFDRLSRLHDAVDTRAQAGELELAIEFRHKDWLARETFDFMRTRGLVYVIVDLPPLPNLPGAEVHRTASTAYIRFHGRNSRNWFNQKLGDRYDYEYSLSELNEWLPHITRLDEEGSTNYIFFNNCHAGQAVKNARMLRQLLEMEFDN